MSPPHGTIVRIGNAIVWSDALVCTISWGILILICVAITLNSEK